MYHLVSELIDSQLLVFQLFGCYSIAGFTSNLFTQCFTSFSIVSSSPLSIHIHSSLSRFISSLNPISIQYSHWCSFLPHAEHFPKPRFSPLRPPHPYTELSIHTSRTPFTFILHVSMEKVVHLLKLNIHIA